MSLVKPKKGSLLFADPSLMGDNSFSKSVILIASHNKDGAVGFILNKPLQYSVSDLVDTIDYPFPVFNGGPVEQDCLYFIHRIPELISDSIEISEGVFWGGNFQEIVELINSGVITSKDIRFFLGYSGWTKDQLEDEIQEQAWIIDKNEFDADIITHTTGIWKNKMVDLGGKYAIWSNAPDSPSLN